MVFLECFTIEKLTGNLPVSYGSSQLFYFVAAKPGLFLPLCVNRVLAAETLGLRNFSAQSRAFLGGAISSRKIDPAYVKNLSPGNEFARCKQFIKKFYLDFFNCIADIRPMAF